MILQIERMGMFGRDILPQRQEVHSLRITSTVANAIDLGPFQLGWLAETVLIDNPTGQWWYIPATGIRVPPNRSNFAAILMEPTQLAWVRGITPLGQTSAPQVGQVLTVIYTSIQLPSCPGG